MKKTKIKIYILTALLMIVLSMGIIETSIEGAKSRVRNCSYGSSFMHDITERSETLKD